MSQAKKILERMRCNPKDDWQISDVKSVCKAFGVSCRAPTGGGSHYTVSHPSRNEILTVPAHKPVKVVYIVKLVLFIESVIGSKS